MRRRLKLMMCAAALEAIIVFVAAFGAWSGSELNPEKHRAEQGVTCQSTACRANDQSNSAPIAKEEQNPNSMDYQPEEKANKNESDGPIRWTDIVVAISAIVNGIFTIALGVSTIFLWAETRNLAKLGREEFIATHRPKIVIRGIICFAEPSYPNVYRIMIIFHNKGESPAIIIKASSIVEITTAHHKHIINPNFSDPAFPIEIDSGIDVLGKIFMIVDSSIIGEGIKIANFILSITYLDNAKRRRKKAVYRTFDIKTGEFNKTERPKFPYKD